MAVEEQEELHAGGTTCPVPPPPLRAVWAGFPARASIQPCLAVEGNVPEDGNSLFAYLCKVTRIDLLHTPSRESPTKINSSFVMVVFRQF